MPRHYRTPDDLRPDLRPARSQRGKLTVRVCAWLALAGAVAAAAAAAFSIFPATASRIDRPASAAPAARSAPSGRPVPQARSIGLDHAGGDLKRSVRLTRRSRWRNLGQLRAWTDHGLIVPDQAIQYVLTVS